MPDTELVANKMTLPYELAYSLNHKKNLNLSTEDYTNLIESLQACGGVKSISRAAEYFSTLSREELLIKISIVPPLDSCLTDGALGKVVSSVAAARAMGFETSAITY